MSLRSRYNFLILGIEKSVQVLIAFVLIRIVNTNLTAVELAEWQFLLNYAIILGTTVNLFPNEIFLADIKHGEEISVHGQRVFSFRLKALSMLTAITTLCSAIYFQSTYITFCFFIIFSGISLMELTSFVHSILALKKQVIKSSFARLLGIFSKLSIVYYFSHTHHLTLLNLSFGFFIEGPVQVAFLLIFGRSEHFALSIKKIWNKTEYWVMFKKGWAYWLTLILQMAYFRFDKLIIKDFFNPIEYSAYTLFYQISESMLLLVFILNSSVGIPLTFSNHKVDKNVIKNIMAIYGGFALVLALGYVFTGRFVLGYIFRPEYLNYYFILLPVILTACINIIEQGLNLTLVATRRQNWVLKRIGIMLLLQIVGTFVYGKTSVSHQANLQLILSSASVTVTYLLVRRALNAQGESA